MPTLEPGLDRLIREAIDDRVLDIHTSTLGTVHTTDGTTADITLPIRRPVESEDGSTQFESMPTLPKVPILWPGANGTSFPIDLKAGDTVLVFFSENSTAEFLQSGGTAEPGDLAMHSLSSAFCMPWGNNCTPCTTYSALAVQTNTALQNIVAWLTTHTHPVAGTVAGVSALPAPTTPDTTATVTRAK